MMMPSLPPGALPAAESTHRTKSELALAMVRTAWARGLRYAWVGADEAYGNNHELTDALEYEGEVFLMDVACSLKVWDRAPRPVEAAPPSTPQGVRHGRPRSRTRVGNAQACYRTVSALAEEEFAQNARVITLRETTKEPLQHPVWVREVWQWEIGRPRARRRLLVVRRERDGSCKYSLSNAANNTSWERLGYMQAQRFWIEQSFQDAKSDLGMADYEVRSWRGWHHHMALVCLAQLFATRERLLAAQDTPLLSAMDIVELLAYYLPRRGCSAEEIAGRIRRRHERRAKAIKSHRKRRTFVTK